MGADPEATIRIGTIGSGECRVTEVSGLASNVGQTLQLKSGVQLRVDPNGTYQCRIPNTLQQDSAELFELVSLVIEEGSLQRTGQLTIRHTEASKDVATSCFEQEGETIVQVRTVTNRKVTIDPRSHVKNARKDSEVVLLQPAESGDTSVIESGEVSFVPPHDFHGRATIRCLVEGQNRQAVFVVLLIDVERPISISTNLISEGESVADGSHRYAITVGGAEVTVSGTAMEGSQIRGVIIDHNGKNIAAAVTIPDVSGIWKLALSVEEPQGQPATLAVVESNQIAARFGGFSVHTVSLTGAILTDD